NAWYTATKAATAKTLTANMTARWILAAALSKAKAAIGYDLIDDGVDPQEPEHNFGLYDHQLQPKPAAAAFRRLAGLLADCKTYEFKVNPAQKVATASFWREGTVSHIVWSYQGAGTRNVCVTVPEMNAPELTDLGGSKLPIVPCRIPAQVKVTLSDDLGP